MKPSSLVLLAILAVCAGSPAFGQEDVWETIKAHLTRIDDSGSREDQMAAKTYLESLTAEQLIEAGRAAGRDVERHTDPQYWYKAPMALAFFWMYYPRASDDLADLGPLLKELAAKDESPVWRKTVFHMLTDDRWQTLLTTEQSLHVADALQALVVDESEPVFLREPIPVDVARMLRRRYLDVVSADPAAKALAAQGRSDQEILREAAAGNLALAQPHAEAASRVADHVKGHFDIDVGLFASTATPTSVRSAAMHAMVIYWGFGFPVAQRAPIIVRDALRDYGQYDQALWPSLAWHALTELEVEGAQSVIEEMIATAHDEEVRSRLESTLRYWRQRDDALPPAQRPAGSEPPQTAPAEANEASETAGNE